MEKAKESLDFAKNACNTFEKSDKEARRNILRSLCSNLSLIDKKLIVSIEKPFQLFSEMKNLYPDIDDTLEPQKTFTNKEQNSIFDDKFSIGCPW